jgi:zinc/manganese transport system ATP-binding protein
MAAALVIDNVTLGYERHPAVHHLSLRIEAGSLVAVMGPNGAGKSTLLKGLAGLLKPLEGRIVGLEQQRVAYMPQLAQVDRSFPISVFNMVAMGLWHEIGALGGLSKSQRQRCVDALGAVGLHDFRERTLDTLSGGQFQRALFARLMLQDASVLLLDEPFAAVDERTTSELAAVLQGWHKAGKTVIAVLHDAELVRHHFDHALLLARELVAWGSPADVLSADNLLLARGLHEAFDDKAPLCDVPLHSPNHAPAAGGAP